MLNQDDTALARYKLDKANSCLKASSRLLREALYADGQRSIFLRTQSDYAESYVVSKQKVKEQYENAERFVKRVALFIDGQIK